MPTAAEPVAESIAVLLQRSFGRQGALMAWQARLQNLRQGACEIVLPMSGAVTQQHGFFHGGVIGAVADSRRWLCRQHLTAAAFRMPDRRI